MDPEENKEGNEPVDYKAKAEQLQAELDKEKAKEKNFSKVKETADEEIKRIAKEKEELAGKITEIEGKLNATTQQQRNDWIDSAISSAVGGDKAKVDAVKAELAVLNMPDGTREEAVAKALKAVKLAGYELKGDVSSISFGSGKEPAKTDKISENSTNFLGTLFPGKTFTK
jgi:multidrug resistance efflux pump